MNPSQGIPLKDSSIRIHDRFQYEVKVDYPVHLRKPSTSYGMEAYVFIPNNLNVNHNTYAKNLILNDIHGHIRFKTPQVALDNICKGDDSPLERLQLSLKNYLAQQSSAAEASMEYNLKMLCCVLKSSLRDYVEQDPLTEHIVRDYVDHTKDHVEKIRSVLRLSHRSLKYACHQPIRFADEYMSFLVEDYSFRLLERLKENHSFLFDKFQKPLLAIIAHEMRYRAQHAMPSIPQAGNDNERYLFRRSVLKKYISNILFCELRVGKESQALQECAYALAAGIAMFFATLLAFFFQRKYGDFTLPFFIAVIVGYMFKDRLKEFMRHYISERFIWHRYDFRSTVYDQHRCKIGICSEGARFCREGHVDASILAIRNRDPITDISNENLGEKILWYRKDVKIFNKALSSKVNPVSGLSDIMRFNIAQCLKYMDNPDSTVHILDRDTYHQQKAQRVYHINVILKYRSFDKSVIKRLRLILNRDGIKRIEQVPV